MSLTDLPRLIVLNFWVIVLDGETHSDGTRHKRNRCPVNVLYPSGKEEMKRDWNILYCLKKVLSIQVAYPLKRPLRCILDFS